MSQFPLEGGGPYAPRALRGGRPIPQIQQAERPTARENFIMRPDTHSEGAQLAADLERALGGVGSVIGQIGNIAAQDRREQAAADAQKNADNKAYMDGIKALQDKQDAADRLSASRSAAIDAQKLAHGIETGDIRIPDGMSVEDFASTVAQQFGRGDEHSDEFNAVYDAHVVPHLVGTLYKQQDQQAAAARTELIAVAADHVMTAPDEAGVRAALDDVRKITDGKATETAILTGALVPAIESAARAGNRQALDTRLAVLGDRLPDIRQKAEAEYAQARAQHEKRAVEGFHNDIDGMIDSGAPRAAVEERIAKYESLKTVDASVLHAMRRSVASQFAEQERENAKAIDEASFQTQYATKIAMVGAELAAGDQPGRGVDQIPDKIRITLPSGQVVEKSGQEMMEASVAQQFAEIDRRIPGADPASQAAKLDARMDVLRKAPTVTDPSLVRKFTGLSRLVTADTVDANAPRLTDALKTYMTLDRYPAIRDAHIKSETDRALMDAASHIMRNEEGITPIDAIKAAFASRNPENGRQIPKVDFEAANKFLPGSGLSYDDTTRPMVAQLIAERANILQTISPTDQKTALRDAAKYVADNYKPVNGTMIYKRGRPVVDQVDMQAVTNAVVSSFLESHPREGGPDAARGMVIRFDPRSPDSNWRITDLLGRPIMDSPSLRDSDLAAINAVILNQKDIAEFPDRNAKYQKDAASEATGGVAGSIFRTIGKIGSAIGGVSPEPDPKAPTIPSLDKPVEITPHDPSLQPIVDWIKRNAVRKEDPQLKPGQPFYGYMQGVAP